LNEVVANVIRTVKIIKQEKPTATPDKFKDPIYVMGKKYDSVLGTVIDDDILSIFHSNMGIMEAAVTKLSRIKSYLKDLRGIVDGIGKTTNVDNLEESQITEALKSTFTNKKVLDKMTPSTVLLLEKTRDEWFKYLDLMQDTELTKIDNYLESHIATTETYGYSSEDLAEQFKKSIVDLYTSHYGTVDMDILVQVGDKFEINPSIREDLEKRGLEEKTEWSKYVLTDLEKMTASLNSVIEGLPIPGYKKVNKKYHKRSFMTISKIIENIANSSLDNAKEAILSYLNNVKTTWGIYEGMVFYHLDEHDSKRIMTHGAVKHLLGDIENSNSLFNKEGRKTNIRKNLVRSLTTTVQEGGFGVIPDSSPTRYRAEKIEATVDREKEKFQDKNPGILSLKVKIKKTRIYLEDLKNEIKALDKKIFKLGIEISGSPENKESLETQ
jgi:hypothetical protein